MNFCLQSSVLSQNIWCVFIYCLSIFYENFVLTKYSLLWCNLEFVRLHLVKTTNSVISANYCALSQNITKRDKTCEHVFVTKYSILWWNIAYMWLNWDFLLCFGTIKRFVAKNNMRPISFLWQNMLIWWNMAFLVTY